MAAITSMVIAGVGVAASISNGNKASKAADKANATAASANDRSAALAERQQAISEEDRSRWKDNFQPLEDELINESKASGTIANQNKAAVNAAADVASSFGGAREKLKTVPGANPSQQAALQEVNRINLAEAATSASAQTGARQTVRDKSKAALQDAAALGRGLVSNASASLNSAGAGLGSAARFSAGMGEAAGRSSADSFGAAGRIVGGLTKSKPFMDWMNTPAVNDGGYSQGVGSAYGGTTGADGMFTPNRPGM